MMPITSTEHGQSQPHLAAPAPRVGPTGKVPQPASMAIPGLVAASILLSACLLFFVACTSIGWRNAISDSHGFRQSQTAISANAMLRGGPWLIYETPVLGPPWTIPFEFPLYQWMVAALAWSTGMALDPAGRTVSVTFFLLTLWPIERILTGLRFALPCRLVILALLVCSPFYVFWSRTFLIESTALFLATSSLACTLWAIRRPSAGRSAATAAVGSLAAVVKVTTFFPFLVAAAVIVGYQVLRRAGPLAGTGWVRRGLLALACVGVPLVALGTWTRVTDQVKSRNVIGKYITSHSLKKWNFGTVEQRLSAQTWRVFASRTKQPLGGHSPFVVAALGLIMARRRLAEVLGCLMLYLLSLLTFTNLFYVHDYYFFENNIFLVVAVGMAIAAMFERGRPLRDGAIAGLVLVLGSMAFDYARTYLPIQAHNESSKQRLGAAIRERTEPDDVLVLLGFDWSSEVPYYSGRRAPLLASLA